MGAADELLAQPIARPELVVLVGLPSAGKTRLYRRLFAATHSHVSLDVVRKRSRERRLIQEYLEAGSSVVVDNTNVLRTERAVYIELAGHCQVPTRCIELLIDLRDALRRNAGRQGKARIPDVGVIAKYKRFERPLIEEGFLRIQRIRLADDGSIELLRDLRAGDAEL